MTKLQVTSISVLIVVNVIVNTFITTAPYEVKHISKLVNQHFDFLSLAFDSLVHNFDLLFHDYDFPYNCDLETEIFVTYHE